MLLLIGGSVSGGQKFVNDGLVLANAITKHAAMVSVVVNAPLYVDDVPRLVGGYWGVAPVARGDIIVNVDSGIETAWAASTDCRGFYVRPC